MVGRAAISGEYEVTPSLRWATAEVSRNERRDGGGGGGGDYGGGSGPGGGAQGGRGGGQPGPDFGSGYEIPDEEPF